MKHRKRSLRFVAGALTLALVAAACGGDDSDEGDSTDSSDVEQTTAPADDVVKGGRLQMAMNDNIDCYNGLSYYGISWSLFYFMARGLYGYPNTIEAPATDELRPDLATDMPTVSDDGLTYTVTLREGLKFNDGTDVDAGDVVATFERLMDPNIQCSTGGPPASGYYSVIEGVDEYMATLTDDPAAEATISGITAVDDTTVEFKLTREDGSFVRLLAMGWSFIIPSETTREVTETAPPFVGPYMISDYQTDKSLTIDRETEYWPAAVEAGVPEEATENNIDGIDLAIGVTDETQLQQLKDNELDITFDGSAPIGADVPAVIADYPDRATSVPDAAVDYGIFRMDKAPFDNVALRQAVNYAVDRDNIVKILGGEFTRSPWSEILSANLMAGSDDEDGTIYTFDPDQATALVEESGVATPIKIKMVHFQDAPAPEVAASVKENLEAVGFEVELEGISADTFYGVLDDDASDYHIAIAGWGQDYSDAITYFGPLLSCPGGEPTGSNYGNFCDEEFQADLEEISQMPTGPDRAAAFAQLSIDTMRDKAPWWPITNRRKVSFVSERVGNYIWGPAKQFYFGHYFLKDAA
jgi:ABC-type transport system substrate-binding protein